MHLAKKRVGGCPIDAGVCDGETGLEFAQVLRDLLISPIEKAFQHDSPDRGIAVFDLFQNILKNDALFLRFFVGVGVGAIDDDILRKMGGLESAFAFGDVFGVEIGIAAAAKDDMCVGVSRRCEDGGKAVIRDTQEMVLTECGGDTVDAGVERAVGSVFEADGG